MIHAVALAALLSLLWPAALAAEEATIVSTPGQRTELWTGKILTATFRAGMCFRKDGYAKGVFILRHKSGAEDVYHVKGRWQGDEFYLEHGSGHTFSGSFQGEGKIKGKARLRQGISLGMSGERRLNAPLVAHDCAPLKQ